MKDKKKAVPGVAAPKDGKVEQAAGAALSVPDYTMRRGAVSSLLLTGAENAITGREIKRIMGIKDGREISFMVERERRGGVPICASCDGKNPGYYLPGSPRDLEKYTVSLQRRITAITATLEALETALEEWTGQQRL